MDTDQLAKICALSDRYRSQKVLEKNASLVKLYLDMLTGLWPTSCMICLVMSWVGWLVQGVGTISTMGVNSVHTWIC